MMIGNLDDEKKKLPQASPFANLTTSLVKDKGQRPGAAPQLNQGNPVINSKNMPSSVVENQTAPEQPQPQPSSVAATPEPKGTLAPLGATSAPMPVAPPQAPQPQPTSVAADPTPAAAPAQAQTFKGDVLNTLGNNNQSANGQVAFAGLQNTILGKGGATRGEATFNANQLSQDAQFMDQANQVNAFAHTNKELQDQLAAQKKAAEEAAAKAAADAKAKADAAAAQKVQDDAKRAQEAAAKKAEEDAANKALAAQAEQKKQLEAQAKAAAEASKATQAKIITPEKPVVQTQVAPVTTPVQNQVQPQATTGGVTAGSVNAGTTNTSPFQAVGQAITQKAGTATTQIAPTTAPQTTAQAQTAPAATTPAPASRLTAQGNYDAATGQMSEKYQAQFQSDLEKMAADKNFQDKDGNPDLDKIKGQLNKDYPEFMKDTQARAEKSRADEVARIEKNKADEAALAKAEADFNTQSAAAKAKYAQDIKTTQASAQQSEAQAKQTAAQAQNRSEFANFMAGAFKDTPTGRVFNGDYTQLANYLNDPANNEIYSQAMTAQSLAGLQQMAQKNAADAQASAQRAAQQQQAQTAALQGLLKQQADQNAADTAKAQQLAAQKAAFVKAQQDQSKAATEAAYKADQANMNAANKQAVIDQASLGINTARQNTTVALNQALNSGNVLGGLAAMGVPGAAAQLAAQNSQEQLKALILNAQKAQAGVAQNQSNPLAALQGLTGNKTSGGINTGQIASGIGGALAGAAGLPTGLGKIAGGLLSKLF